jgi:hypothetical protein
MKCSRRLSLIAHAALRSALARPGSGTGQARYLAEPLERRLALSAFPSVVSINRAVPAGPMTDAASVSYAVTFSEPVVGVDAGDFTLALNGVTAASSVAVSGSGALYTVGVSGIKGNGTLGLNLVDDGSIHDSAGNRLLQTNAPAAFAGQSTFAVGSSPRSLAVADLNGDGKPDIVTANGSDSSVSVLLGNGDDTFQAQQIYNTGYFSGPQAVVSADVNSDGSPDLLVANSQRYTIGVLLGKGDGSFQPQKEYQAGEYPRSIAVADVNGDGRPDLAVANYDTVGVMLGNGDGTFKPQQTFATGVHANSLALEDVNGDGKLDAIVNSFATNSIEVVPGNGDGTFGSPQGFAAGNRPNFVAAADVNGDGRPDLIVANSGDNTVGVLLAQDGGAFNAQVAFPAGVQPESVTVADINWDGKADLIVGNNSQTLSVLLSNGNGTFQPPVTLLARSSPQSPAVADINGDGRPDLVAANKYDNSVSVLLGNANGSFSGELYTIDHLVPSVESITRTDPAGPLTTDDSLTYTVSFSEPVTGVDPSDFMLALTGTVTGAVMQVTPANTAVYTVTVGGITGSGTLGLNLVDDGSIHDLAGMPLAGSAPLTRQSTSAVGAEPLTLAVADLNGDTVPDLLAGGFGGRTISELLGNSDGTFQSQTQLTTSSTPRSVAAADVNGDGKPDLVYGAALYHVSVALGSGDGSFGAPASYATGSDVFTVAVADVNGDGKADVVTSNQGSGNVSVFLGNGDGTLQPQTAFPAGSRPHSLSIADVNGDGKPDLIVALETGGAKNVSLLLGKGNGTFSAPLGLSGGSDGYSAAVADVNGDGGPDLVIVNFLSRSVSVLLGNGDGTFQPKVAYAVGANPAAVVIADVNGDGNPDLAVTNLMDNTVSLLLGKGDGSFRPRKDFATGIHPWPIAAADVNGDGRPDVVVANNGSNSVSILLNGGNGDFAGDLYAINSATPAVNAFAMTGGVEGTATPPVGGSFTGQPQDAFTATVDYGDGGGAQSLTLNGNNFTLSHAYAEGGTYDVTVVVTDTTAGLLAAPVTAAVVVSDVAVVPTISGAPATLALGGSANLNFTATNPNALEMGPLIESWTIRDGSNAVVASGTGGSYTFTPAAVGTYTVTFTAGESTIADAETGTATATITVNPAAPALVSTTIDDGVRQRSLVRSLTFSFSSPVTLSAGAITLARLNTGDSGANDGSAPTDASSALGTPASSDGGLTWVVPIQASGAFSGFGSLADGIYTATVHAGLVTDSFNQQMAGGDQTKTFHRLFGDINGDKRVNATDYQRFSAAFGSSNLTANYNVYFDFNHDGRVNATDYQQLSTRFGKSFVYTG